MHYILFNLTPTASTVSGSKAYKISLPVPSTTKWPLLSVNEDTGKYVKAILLNREKLLGKQICAAEEKYTIGETIKVMNEGGMDIAFEQYSIEQYQKALAEKGLPDFFIEDMTENMSFVEELGSLVTWAWRMAMR